MPRRKPDKIVEHRLALSTWERERLETLGVAVGVGAVGVGIGAVAIPIALVAGGIVTALLLADNVEDMIEKAKALPGAVLGDPNDLGGEKAEKAISEGITAVDDDLGASPFERYGQVKNWQKIQRTQGFVDIHGPGSQDDPALASEWAAWIVENPIPIRLSLNEGGAVGGGAAMGGAMYQVSIRITAARRRALEKGNLLTNPLGTVADWMGQAAGGEDYYTKPEDASGYLADPLLDLLAIRMPGDWTPWKGTTTKIGSEQGLLIEQRYLAQLALA